MTKCNWIGELFINIWIYYASSVRVKVREVGQSARQPVACLNIEFYVHSCVKQDRRCSVYFQNFYADLLFCLLKTLLTTVIYNFEEVSRFLRSMKH